MVDILTVASDDVEETEDNCKYTLSISGHPLFSCLSKHLPTPCWLGGSQTPLLWFISGWGFLYLDSLEHSAYYLPDYSRYILGIFRCSASSPNTGQSSPTDTPPLRTELSVAFVTFWQCSSSRTLRIRAIECSKIPKLEVNCSCHVQAFS